MSHIYIIHENDDWTAPLRTELAALGLPYREWFLDSGHIDTGVPPPAGVFYNRMSASSHTRGHRHAPEYTAMVLAWLEAHGRRVINSSRALQLEVSKVAQYAALSVHGIRTPRTVAVAGQEEIIEAARRFDRPFIIKPNRGGRGLGVRLFRNMEALRQFVYGAEFEAPIDGITLVQEYIQASEPFITRCEFAGGDFLYAVRVDTSQGFELCPADECQIDDAFCPTITSQTSKFHILKDFGHPIIERYTRFLDANQVHVAGIEFVLDRRGELFTYDINTNTNYNREAETLVAVSGMRTLATYLGAELGRLSDPVGPRQKELVG